MVPRTLTLCEYNVENLFIGMEFYRGQSLEAMSEHEWRELALSQLRRKQKPLHKVQGVARALLDIDPDIVMLTEVGGADSLENFNRHFLGERFKAYFIEGNSRRGIDLAFLVRKGLGLDVRASSNRDTPIALAGAEGVYHSKFSRDVAELRLSENGTTVLIALLVHLKSKISTEHDLRGKDVRTAEAIALARLYEAKREQHPDVPIVLAGDFNSDISSLEFELLRRTDLRDFHELAGTPQDERTSLVYFDYVGNPNAQVLDYILVSSHLKERVVREKSYTYRYKGFYDIAEPLPRSLKERNQMPSDHYPLVLTIAL